MTRGKIEELEKEADEWLCNNLHSASEEDFIKAMVDIAEPREKRIAELEKENAELKILISSMLYEINALWDISEMNEDVRKHAERIDSEVEK